MQTELNFWRLRLAVVLAGGILVLGCDSGPTTYDVTGTVTYQGKPVDRGTINFRSEDGKLYGGGLQDGGKFEFRLPTGEFAVRVDAPAPLPSGWKEGDPLPQRQKRLAPMKYANYRSANLQATVTQDPATHAISFELE